MPLAKKGDLHTTRAPTPVATTTAPTHRPTDKMTAAATACRIAITEYTAPFAAYPPLFLAAVPAHVTLPSLSSHMGQALALLAQPENAGLRYCTRDDCEAFFTAIGMPSGDAIQAFNKFPQRGIALGSKPRSGQYMLPLPFRFELVHLAKRTGATLASADKSTAIRAIKDYFRTTIVDVPEDAWQVGHLDPTIGDASASNLAWQPPIQAVTRDRFKFDATFRKMWPTGKELTENLDKYYTAEEQRALFLALKSRLE